MLTRRQQRIKAIQYLFAYEQQCYAALRGLQDVFEDSMLEKGYTTHSSRTQKENVLDLRNMTLAHILNPRHRVAPSFQKAFAEYLAQRQNIAQQVAESISAQQKEIENNCLRLLLLFLELAKEAPALATTPFIHSLMQDPALKKECAIRKLNWNQHPDYIARWGKLLKKHSIYLNKENNLSPAEETLWFQKLIKKCFLRDLPVHALMEEESICWHDNKKVVQRLLFDMIKNNQKKEGEEWMFYTLSAKLEKAFAFVLLLYEGGVAQGEEWESLIEKVAKNWEARRITMIDKMIMKTALSEMTHGDHIPLNVTINEYIEIAKTYSSPQSGAFVHGLLDAMAKTLHAQGHIHKQRVKHMDSSTKK